MATNGNSEKRWLTWVVRIMIVAVIPALVGALWWSLGKRIGALESEVRALRVDVGNNHVEALKENAQLASRITYLEAKVLNGR